MTLCSVHHLFKLFLPVLIIHYFILQFYIIWCSIDPLHLQVLFIFHFLSIPNIAMSYMNFIHVASILKAHSHFFAGIPFFLNKVTALDFDIMLEIFINIIQMVYFN